MDKIEKICAEIERHLNSAIEHQNTNPDMPKYRWYLYEGAKELCTNLLDYLEDAFSEEPDKSLEEAAYKYSFDSRPSIYGQVDVIDAFKAGAEWQAKQLLQGSPMPEDTVLFQKGVAEGRRLEREDMMKDAYVESQIVEDGRIELGGDPLPCLNPIILLPYPQFQPGDKVKFIIVKED